MHGMKAKQPDRKYHICTYTCFLEKPATLEYTSTIRANFYIGNEIK